MWETRVRSLGWEDPLEKELATHSSTLDWKIPWTEEPGRLQSVGSQSQTRLSDFTSLHFILITSIWMMSKTILDQRANSKLWKHVFRSGHIYFRKWVEEEEESTLIPKVWSVLILGLITPALWSQHLLCQRAIYFRSQHNMRRLRIYRAVLTWVSTFRYL